MKSLQELCHKYKSYGYGVILIFEKKHQTLGTMLEYIPFVHATEAESWVTALREAEARNDHMCYTVGTYIIIETGTKINF